MLIEYRIISDRFILIFLFCVLKGCRPAYDLLSEVLDGPTFCLSAKSLSERNIVIKLTRRSFRAARANSVQRRPVFLAVSCGVYGYFPAIQR